MSTLKIEERITVAAPPARVWKFLLDPARVAGCLPGAKLDGTEGDRTFLGTMKVKVGPVSMEFKGKATMSEIVEAERRVTMTGTGNDKSGGGSAKMDMKSQINAIDGGGSEIVVVADVDLAGKLVRFGRGMMEGISKQLFKQFSERVRAELEGEEEEAAAEEKAAQAEDKVAHVEEKQAIAEEKVAQAEERGAQAEEKVAQAEEKVAQAEDKVAHVEEKQAIAEEKEALTEEKQALSEEKQAPVAKKKAAKKKAAPIVKTEDEALDAGSLVWSALWAWIRGLFERVFGKRK